MYDLRDALILGAAALVVGCFAVEGRSQAAPSVTGYSCSENRSIFEEVYDYKPLFDCSAAKHGALHNSDLEVLGFTIGRSTLRDVEKRFPGTTVGTLTGDPESDFGICIKNREGNGVVFVSGIMSSGPGKIISLYFAPARLIEKRLTVCKTVDIPTKEFSTHSGIHAGMASTRLSDLFRHKMPADGSFCIPYIVSSSQGPLLTDAEKHSKLDEDMTDFTGISGCVSDRQTQWVKIFGVTSD